MTKTPTCNGKRYNISPYDTREGTDVHHTSTHCPQHGQTEHAIYSVMFTHDAEVAARFDRAVWRAECIALALEISEDGQR